MHRRMTTDHRRQRRGSTLGTPTGSVTCSLQLPGAHMLQVQDKLERLEKKPQNMHSSPSTRAAPAIVCLGLHNPFDLNVHLQMDGNNSCLVAQKD